MHPNLWIIESAAKFVVNVCTTMSAADIYCLIYPHLSPFLRVQISNLSEMAILQSLRRPISESVLEYASKWAMKSMIDQRGTFWSISERAREFSLDAPLQSGSGTRDKKIHLLRLPMLKSAEDVARVANLRALGMKAEDDWKFMVLRDFIWRSAQSRYKEVRRLQLDRPLTLITVPTTIVRFDQLSQVDHELANVRHTTPHDVQRLLRETDNKQDIDPPKGAFREPHDTRSNRLDQRTGDMAPMLGASDRVNMHTKDKSDRQDIFQAFSSVVAPQTDGNFAGEVKSSFFKVGSAMSRQTSGVKAAPAISTTNTIALGQVDHHSVAHSTENSLNEQSKRSPVHTSCGTDNTVLRALESFYKRQDPIRLVSLVSDVAPLRPVSQDEQIRRQRKWRGTLVAHIHEHQAAINCVRTSPDHTFFLTASDDGTIKAWDPSRFERTVANRARLTYRGMSGSKVRQLCFLENSYCVAAASDVGVIQIIRVECTTTFGSTIKFSGMHLLRELQLRPGEAAVQMEHFIQNQLSVLLVITNRCRVVAIDALAMTILYELHNPPRHGTPTCCCTDEDKTWLLLGTTRGILSLWDLRFQIRIRSIGLPQASQVLSVYRHPTRGNGKWICVSTAVNNEISIWDIENALCQSVYRPLGQDGGQSESYKARDVDTDNPEVALARITSEVSLAAVDDEASRSISNRGLAIYTEPTFAKDHDSFACIIAASTDQIIRVWNLDQPEKTTIISGLPLTERPNYGISEFGYLKIVCEIGKTYANNSFEGKSSKGDPRLPSRSTALALQQSQLLNNHLDTVLAVAYLQWPYSMIISADRSGVLKLFS